MTEITLAIKQTRHVKELRFTQKKISKLLSGKWLATGYFIIRLLNDKHPYTTSYGYSHIKKNTFYLEESKYDLKYSAL